MLLFFSCMYRCESVRSGIALLCLALRFIHQAMSPLKQAISRVSFQLFHDFRLYFAVYILYVFVSKQIDFWIITS